MFLAITKCRPDQIQYGGTTHEQHTICLLRLDTKQESEATNTYFIKIISEFFHFSSCFNKIIHETCTI